MCLICKRSTDVKRVDDGGLDWRVVRVDTSANKPSIIINFLKTKYFAKRVDDQRRRIEIIIMGRDKN